MSKYIPPHLRRQMEEDQQQQTSTAPSVASGAPGVSSFSRPSTGGQLSFSERLKQKLPVHTSTSWSTRDGRRPFHEYESDLFQVSHVTSGIKFDDYDKIPVEVSGRDAGAIVCIERFKEASLDAQLSDNIERCGYIKPTPVQKHSIPIVLGSRDLMASAQTGSGKTAGFLVPIIQKMLAEGPPAESGSTGYGSRGPAFPVALVLAPTRELAMQIFEEARKFCFGTGVRPVVLYGGAEIRLQMRELERGCDICIACPGRLIDLIQRGRISVEKVRHLVLDEADRMLDMGFEPVIRDIVEQFGMPQDRQSVMFSATFPKEIQRLARDFLNDYVFLTVGRVGSTHQNITQYMKYTEDHDKYRELCRILKEQGKEAGLTLVFVETKRRADELESSLTTAGFPATSIHGDREQADREEALRRFKSGRCPVLVATDVASRGLDIPNVNHVINFDLPKSIDDYVHRIGRTGRAGNLGKATAFVNDNARPILRDLLQLLEESKQETPEWFTSFVERATGRPVSRGGRGGNRGGQQSGGSRFGGRDMRGGESRQYNNESRPQFTAQQQPTPSSRSYQQRPVEESRVPDNW
jgi:ATP-dependent RNA helicase DDX3X